VATNVLPNVDPDNVLVGQAAVRLFPLTGTGPAPALPLDTVALNGAWPVGWVAIGATEAGVSLGFQRTTQDIRIEERSVAVDVTTTETMFTVDTELAEDTIDTMLIAFGGGVTNIVAATPTTNGRKTLKVSSELDHFALGMEGRNEFGAPRRILIPTVLSIANATTAFRRAAAKRTWKVQFKSLVEITDCDIVDILPKTGP
jgi:hypothetical protein